MRRCHPIVVLFLSACGPTAEENAEQAVQVLRARVDSEIVMPTCTGDRRPETRCGLIAELQGWGSAEHFEATLGCSASDAECSQQYQDLFARALRIRYPLARSPDVGTNCERSAICGSYGGLELAHLAAHNARADEFFYAGLARIQATFKANLAQEQEERERRRRVGRAIAAGLNAFGKSMQGSANYAPAYTPSGCTSDFACGVGQQCVKAQNQYTGFCARSVDSFGAQQYSTPRSDSIGAGEAQCQFDTECSIGFRCVSDHCIK